MQLGAKTAGGELGVGIVRAVGEELGGRALARLVDRLLGILGELRKIERVTVEGDHRRILAHALAALDITAFENEEARVAHRHRVAALGEVDARLVRDRARPP